jgi:hypothetical protein
MVKVKVPRLIKMTAKGEELEVDVNKSTASAWLTLLAECLVGIGEALAVFPFVAKPLENAQFSIPAAKLRDAHQWISVLYILTECTAVFPLFRLFYFTKRLVPAAITPSICYLSSASF